MSADQYLRSGDLKQPISIRIKPTARTSANGEIDVSLTGTNSWAIRCSPRAKITFLKGLELIRSERDVSETWVKFSILYRTDVPLATDRIIWRSRIFDVITVGLADAGNDMIEMDTKEVK